MSGGGSGVHQTSSDAMLYQKQEQSSTGKPALATSKQPRFTSFRSFSPVLFNLWLTLHNCWGAGSCQQHAEHSISRNPRLYRIESPLALCKIYKQQFPSPTQSINGYLTGPMRCHKLVFGFTNWTSAFDGLQGAYGLLKIGR